MKSIYIINEAINKYRWIGLPETDEAIGIRLAKVKFEPVKSLFDPIKVEWLPETLNREVCDFPHFRSIFTCMSEKAIHQLGSLIESSGEFLDLYGVEVNYSAFHCLTVYDALDHYAVTEMQKNNEYFSLASPREILPLLSERIGDSHIFHIPEVRNKFFVSQEFKNIYNESFLTGLTFHEIPLR